MKFIERLKSLPESLSYVKFLRENEPRARQVYAPDMIIKSIDLIDQTPVLPISGYRNADQEFIQRFKAFSRNLNMYPVVKTSRVNNQDLLFEYRWSDENDGRKINIESMFLFTAQKELLPSFTIFTFSNNDELVTYSVYPTNPVFSEDPSENTKNPRNPFIYDDSGEFFTLTTMGKNAKFYNIGTVDDFTGEAINIWVNRLTEKKSSY